MSRQGQRGAVLIARMWRALGQVRCFEFSAVPGAASKTRWEGQAAGSVEVSSTQESGCLACLLFEETGSFRMAEGGEVPVQSRLKWRRQPEGLECLRERQGTWTYLLKLVPGAEGFVPEEAHICGDDHYRAWLEFCEPGVLELRWQITGPKKDEAVSYRYSP